MKNQVKKNPTSSQVHVPSAGEEQKLRKDNAPNQEPTNDNADLQDAQELVSGMDWEMEHEKMDPNTARELAHDNLAQDPQFYRKKRLEQDWTSDELYKSEDEPDGYWVDLGSSNCRQPGHIGLDLYPYDYGTAVHDINMGLPFPDESVAKIRAAHVLDDENVEDPKAILSEVQRVLMPGGQFVYEGPNDIQNYPEWAQDYPGMVLTDHQDDSGIQKNDAPSVVRQQFTRVAMPDPATANDAEPRIGIASYDALPSDALLAMDQTSYLWSDSTSSGRGNRAMGYPSQGGLANEPNSTEKGGEGSGPQGGSSSKESDHTKSKVNEMRQAYQSAKGPKKDSLHGELQRAILDHQQAAHRDSYQERRPYANHMLKSIEKEVAILKAEGMKQVVYCVVLEPDTVDAQEDFMTADDIEETAHNYLIKARLIGSDHTQQIDAAPCESYIAPQDLQYEGQNGPQVVKKGSWVIGVKVFNPDEWQKVLNGEYTGVSVGGEGIREDA